MFDQIYDRTYQQGRQALHEGIDRLIAETGSTFRKLHRIQWKAPWDMAAGSATLPASRTGCA